MKTKQEADEDQSKGEKDLIFLIPLLVRNMTLARIRREEIHEQCRHRRIKRCVHGHMVGTMSQKTNLLFSSVIISMDKALNFTEPRFPSVRSG